MTTEAPALPGRIAIITGGGRGIGAAIAQRYAREGARVLVAARSAEQVVATARSIEEAGGCAASVTADVSTIDGARTTVQACLDRFGGVDVLVNCAGIYGAIGPLAGTDPALWLETIATNLGGTYLCTRFALPSMLAQQRGKIVNFSGGGASAGRPNFSAYAAAKTAVVRLTETLAAEVQEQNVQVNAIAPGGVDTHLIDVVLAAGDLAGPVALAEARDFKQGRGTPLAEVADLATFLASDASGALSGRLISAVWDDWRTLPARAERIMANDALTLRRVELKG
jgi:NAD(P)-dependent dehydrogenase (short-subunit alcohol dehydrogenase family)